MHDFAPLVMTNLRLLRGTYHRTHEMQSSSLYAVGAVYFLLIANFYNESQGFTKKVIPILFLTLFAAVDGGGLPKRDRKMCALGLFFGGVGDVLIGVKHEGIVPGAISFGIGHFFYME
ncbi:hypothetical protein ANCDUO_13390 [Ancylostoma duodenale]|uniref:lysoplasmalogenase n=1 Tax=Ancylostoma duodenale TaxID=51022 RepID=A0A0C2GC37_9BILA|nr:hypothetical protein ANCDUO_13390 [Ancylostoma duodenale]